MSPDLGRRSRYVESPQEWQPVDGECSVFLAGGITGCSDWQREMRVLLGGSGLVLLNPRRRNFPINAPAAAAAQIEWEYRHLRKADLISFWFCADTLCPIVLYELGAWSMTSKPIAVGIEHGYQRAQDVIIQTGLVRPDVGVVSSIPHLAVAIRDLVEAVR